MSRKQADHDRWLCPESGKVLTQPPVFSPLLSEYIFSRQSSSRLFNNLSGNVSPVLTRLSIGERRFAEVIYGDTCRIAQHCKGPVRDKGSSCSPGRFLCNNSVSLTAPPPEQDTRKNSRVSTRHREHRVQCDNLKDHTNLKPLREQKLNYD